MEQAKTTKQEERRSKIGMLVIAGIIIIALIGLFVLSRVLAYRGVGVPSSEAKKVGVIEVTREIAKKYTTKELYTKEGGVTFREEWQREVQKLID